MPSRFLDVALDAAVLAGKKILSLHGDSAAEKKPDESLITRADMASDEVISERIKRSFPKHALVSEERYEDSRRFCAEYTWIVDPLDGTRDFVKQTGQFAVHIGLVCGTEPVLGVVYVPMTDSLYHAAPGLFAGARKICQGKSSEIHVNDCALEDAVLILSSNKFSKEDADRAAQHFGMRRAWRSGGLGCKMMAVAEGTADVYIYERQKVHEWDTLAPDVILRAACGRLTDYFGNSLEYNVPRTGVFARGLVCAPEQLHGEVLKKVQSVIPLK